MNRFLLFVAIVAGCMVCISGASSALTSPKSWLRDSRSDDSWLDGSTRRDRRRIRKVKNERSKGLIIPKTELGCSSNHIWIVTTASLPWMTGTSINPLLRAACLTRGRAAGMVTLMVPFISVEEQKKIFAEGVTFDTQEDLEVTIKEWLVSAGYRAEAEKLRIVFYPGRYHRDYGSIFPMGNIVSLVPKEEAQICILEEPEHLNWYRAPSKAWTEHFDHVVGIMHTNYLAYSSGYSIYAPILTFLLRIMNRVVTRGQCDKIIKLSPVIQQLAKEKETVCNVHGVRGRFLEVGAAYAHKKHTKGAYFVGKSLWAKGHSNLLKYMKYLKETTGQCFDIDVYGSGPDKDEIVEKAKEWDLPCTFFPAKDHAALEDYKVFVNPSVSEVLCTTIAEALAMGKWAICCKHPSNTFFYQFPNCLSFETPEEFVACVSYALRHEPTVLTDDQRHILTWEAATDRLLASSCITLGQAQRKRGILDRLARDVHSAVGAGRGGDVFRMICGADTASGQVKFMREQTRTRKENS